MNKLFLYTLATFVLLGCRRKDYYLDDNKATGETYIKLNGSDNIDIAFGSTYNDLGATAFDAQGNELIVLVDYNGFSSTRANSYVINYSATDGNGLTVSTTRTVNVVLKATDIAGNYSVQSDCKYSIPTVPIPINFFKNSADVVSSVGTNQLEFQNIDFAGGSDVFNATISGRDITVEGSLTISPVGISTPFTYEFSGTGEISEDARTITVNYLWENVTPLIGGSVSSCIAIYTKN